ncbi:MAG: RNA 2',3'-cyclic phosphodiesterase, partial [Clostridiales bacterium]|nr:RNA 2',3'-cyclic phosphodiesterase [Clostridiales bacterium]
MHRLLAMQQALAERTLFLKLTPDNNLHLTLRFIGACDDGLTEGVQDWFHALPQTDLEAAAGVLTGFGQFLNRDGLTVYAAVRVNPGLTALQGQLEQGLRGLGIGAETRPFVPHITLARKVKLRRALDGAEDGAGTRF